MRAMAGHVALTALLMSGPPAAAQLPPPPYPDPPPYPSYPDPGPLPAVAPWPANGVPVCTAAGNQDRLIASDDFAHGAYFAWEDHRGSSVDVYAIRIGPNGQPEAGWSMNGNLVGGGSGDERLVACLSDGPWGAFFAWSALVDGRNALFVQRLMPDGSIAPGWPAAGRRICENDGQDFSFVYLDRQGGLQIVWFSDGKRKATVYHMAPDGSPHPGWPECGIVAVAPYGYEDPCCGPMVVRIVELAAPIWPDGAFVVSRTHGWRNECHGNPDGSVSCVIHDYMGCSGEVVFQGPGWSQPALQWFPGRDCLFGPAFRPDEAGGTLVMWPDSVGRAGVLGHPSWTLAASMGDLLPAGDGSFHLRVGDRYVRLLGDGSMAPGWSLAAPTSACDPPCRASWGHAIAPDGEGGMFFAWTDYRSGDWDIYAGHLLSDGTRDPRLPASGRPIGSGIVPSYAPTLVSDRRGNVIVAWSEEHSGQLDLYAYRLSADIPVGVQASLVSSAASPERVEIVWYVTSRAEQLSVERRHSDEPWRWIADLAPDGQGRALLVDSDVQPGASYRYRLTASGQVLSEISVEVPALLALSFDGARPNPTSRGIEVGFTLPTEHDVELRLTDVVGRLIRKRTLGSTNAGRHAVTLTAPGELAAGAYFIEFRAGPMRTVRRAVIIH